MTARTALKFLYARKFDVVRAVALYEQHHQIRVREGLYHIDPYLEPLHAELQTGKFTILVGEGEGMILGTTYHDDDYN